MLLFRRFTLALITLSILMSGCHSQALDDHGVNVVEQATEATMLTTTNNMIQQVTLLAREEIHPPPGLPPQRDRDIGFATVFLALENHTSTEVKIDIQRVEIRNVSDETLHDFSFLRREIVLKPLENAKISLDLTNKVGYAGQDRVKAVVAYQVSEYPIEVVESEPVEVDRH